MSHMGENEIILSCMLDSVPLPFPMKRKESRSSLILEKEPRRSRRESKATPVGNLMRSSLILEKEHHLFPKGGSSFCGKEWCFHVKTLKHEE